MTEYTPNGYPVILDQSGTRLWSIPKCERSLRLLPGPCGFVLTHWITWFDRNIEWLDAPGETYDEWGWNARPNVNDPDVWSNHASATAADLNSAKHPNGMTRTFTITQVTKMQDRLAERYGNVIKLGVTYHSTPDPMHHELNASRRDVTRIARALFDTSIGREVRAANKHFKWTP